MGEGMKWDKTRKHTIKISVNPQGDDTSHVGIVWGDGPEEVKTLKNSEVEQLLNSLAQRAERLGYMQ